MITDVSDLVGKPFKWGGRGPDFYDCVGICMEVARRAKVPWPEGDTPEDKNVGLALFEKHMRDWKKVQVVGLPEPGLTVLMRIEDAWHVGMLISKYGEFIHIVDLHKVIISSINDPLWKGFILGFYTYQPR